MAILLVEVDSELNEKVIHVTGRGAGALAFGDVQGLSAEPSVICASQCRRFHPGPSALRARSGHQPTDLKLIAGPGALTAALPSPGRPRRHPPSRQVAGRPIKPGRDQFIAA
jgi:hypothetical protein